MLVLSSPDANIQEPPESLGIPWGRSHGQILLLTSLLMISLALSYNPCPKPSTLNLHPQINSSFPIVGNRRRRLMIPLTRAQGASLHNHLRHAPLYIYVLTHTTTLTQELDRSAGLVLWMRNVISMWKNMSVSSRLEIGVFVRPQVGACQRAWVTLCVRVYEGMLCMRVSSMALTCWLQDLQPVCPVSLVG